MLALYSALIAVFSISPIGIVRCTPDSEMYLYAARNLVGGLGFGIDYLSWPPLYPLLLTPLVFFHIESYSGALNLLLLAVYLYVFLIILRTLGSTLLMALMMAVALAYSSPIQLVFTSLWSETLFLPLSLAWLLIWGRYLVEGRFNDLIRASWLNAMCLSTRHAGIPIAVVMLLTLILRIKHRPPMFRWSSLFVISLSTAPYLIWLARTYMVSVTFTGPRTPQPQPIWMLLSGFSATLSHWMLPGIYLHGYDGISIGASVVLIGGACCAAIYFLRAQFVSSAKKFANGTDLQLTTLSLSFAMVYLGFVLLTTTRTFLDVPNDRYLSPAFAPLLGAFFFIFISVRVRLGSVSSWMQSVWVGLGWSWILGEILLP